MKKITLTIAAAQLLYHPELEVSNILYYKHGGDRVFKSKSPISMSLNRKAITELKNEIKGQLRYYKSEIKSADGLDLTDYWKGEIKHYKSSIKVLTNLLNKL